MYIVLNDVIKDTWLVWELSTAMPWKVGLSPERNAIQVHKIYADFRLFVGIAIKSELTLMSRINSNRQKRACCTFIANNNNDRLRVIARNVQVLIRTEFRNT